MNKTWRIIPALDISDLDRAATLAATVGGHPLVYGFKVGFSLGLTHGLPVVVARIKAVAPDKPIIYDHQKAGTDIPATGELFAATLASAGIDQVILFPQAGPTTQAAWIDACMAHGLKVILGGAMTHHGYLATEGGYLRDDAPAQMYRNARQAGVGAFVVPLTRPELTRKLMDHAGLPADGEYYSPGYGKQGGDPAAFDFIHTHYLIIGRSLLEADDPYAYLDEVHTNLYPDER